MFSRLRLSTASIFSILLLSVPGVTRAQTPPAPSDAPKFTTGAELVALDLVVRDKKGRLVTDLQASEIEVLENGVPQKITSFRTLESGAASAGDPAPATSGQPTAAATPPGAAAQGRRVVLAFGRLSSEGRRLAQSAGDEFAKKHVGPGTLVTVLKIDGTLVPVIEGTVDPVAVKEAVRKATAAISGGPTRAMGPVGADSSYAGTSSKRFEGGSGVLEMAQADNLAFLRLWSRSWMASRPRPDARRWSSSPRASAYRPATSTSSPSCRAAPTVRTSPSTRSTCAACSSRATSAAPAPRFRPRP